MTASTVQDVLQAYANRGVLRNFQAEAGGAADAEFGFLWMNHKPMRLQWKASSRTLVFRDLAPNVPSRGPMDREIKRFVSGLTSPDLPAHRRVNPADFEIFSENRRSNVSIGLRLAEDVSEAEAAETLMQVAHEVFLFLHDRWLDYMHEEFGASLE